MHVSKKTDITQPEGFWGSNISSVNVITGKNGAGKTSLLKFIIIFAVSLYNLVPSCSTCNHMKTTEEIGVSPHDHSYDFSNMRITYTPCTGNWIENSNDIRLDFVYKNDEYKAKMELNLETLGIKYSYSMHTDYVQEILKKAQIYGPEMRNSLMTQFPDLFSSEEELLRIIFGNYIDIKDTLKRPLAKLTQDLLEELGIIK